MPLDRSERGRRRDGLRELQLERLGLAAPHDFELEVAAVVGNELAVDLPDRHLPRRPTADARQDVAALDSGSDRGATLLHAGDVGDPAVLQDHEAGMTGSGQEVALPGGRHGRRQVDREGIERVGRTFHRAGQEGGDVGRLDVGLAHQIERLGEDREITVEGVGIRLLVAGIAGAPQHAADERQHHEERKGEEAPPRTVRIASRRVGGRGRNGSIHRGHLIRRRVRMQRRRGGSCRRRQASAARLADSPGSCRRGSRSRASCRRGRRSNAGAGHRPCAPGARRGRRRA